MNDYFLEGFIKQAASVKGVTNAIKKGLKAGADYVKNIPSKTKDGAQKVKAGVKRYQEGRKSPVKWYGDSVKENAKKAIKSGLKDMAPGVVLGTTLGTGAVVGGKKVYDKYKK